VTCLDSSWESLEALGNGRDKAVAGPIQRLDELWLATAAANGSAYLCDTTGQGPITDALLRPQLLEEFLLWHDAVAMLDEVGQDVKHERFKLDECTGTVQFIALRVELEVSKDIKHPSGPPTVL